MRTSRSRSGATHSALVRLGLHLVRVALLGMLLWQGALIEVVVSHDIPADCGDDDRGACAPNCHCCLTCAHHGIPGLPHVGLVEPQAHLDFVEIPSLPKQADPSSLVRGPPSKIPKLST